MTNDKEMEVCRPVRIDDFGAHGMGGTDDSVPAESGYGGVTLDRADDQTDYELRIHSETEEILKEESENDNHHVNDYLAFDSYESRKGMTNRAYTLQASHYSCSEEADS